MYLRKTYDKRINKTYLSIAQGYRDGNGKPKTKVIKHLGCIDGLLNEHPDPITHFTAVAKSMDEERKEVNKIPVTINMNTQLTTDETHTKNYGYLVFSKLYHELELDRFLDNARRHENFSFNSEAIMRLLVNCRLLNPGSKREALLNKDLFFDNFDFSLDDTYHALDHFNKISEPLQKHLHKKMIEQYARKTDLVY
jgi:hypothetical protein